MPGLSPAELTRLAEAKYGKEWAYPLARALGLTAPSVYRWKIKGIRDPARADEVWRVLSGDLSGPKPSERPTADEPDTSSLSFDLARARSLLEAGHDMTATAKMVGVARITIRRHVKRGNLPAPDRKKFNPERARKLLLGGSTVAEVAKAVGVSESSIYRHQLTGLLPPCRDRYRPVAIGRILRMLAGGKSVAEVAFLTGVTPASLYERLRRHRKKSEG